MLRPLVSARLKDRSPAPLRAGFTLIELLAAMLILGILMAFLLPQIPAAIDRARVTACKANLGKIGQGLLAYRAKYNRYPKQGGVAFFAALISDEVWDATQQDSKKLTCPGVEDNVLVPFNEDIPRADWYVDKNRLGPQWSTYAGRDIKGYPIRSSTQKNIGREALVGDDNDGGANHRTSTCVLYGDYSVNAIEIVEERDAGNATPEDDWVVVGADAWREDLQKLSITK